MKTQLFLQPFVPSLLSPLLFPLFVLILLSPLSGWGQCSISASPNDTICPGGTVVLQLTGGTGNTSWSYSPDNITYTTVTNGTPATAVYNLSGSNNVTLTISGITVAGSYFYKATRNGGVSCTLMLVVLANPTTASAGPDQAICNNGTFTMAGNTPSVGTGTWSVASGSSATIVTPGSPTTEVNSIASGTCAFLVWTIANGVCTIRDTVRLCNDALPTTSNAGPDQTKCNNGTFTMAGNNPTLGSGTWTVASGSSATIVTPGSPTTSVNSISSGTCAFLVWTVTNGVCTSRDTVRLCNDALSTTANAGSDQSKCNNGTFTMAGNTPTIGSGTWTVASGSSATIVTPGSPTTSVNSIASGTCAFLVWTITNGVCTSRDTVRLCNDALPTNANAGSDQTKCNNGTFAMAGNAPTVGTGTWSVASGSSANIVTPGSPTTSVNSVASGTCALLVWTIASGVCSSSRDTVILCNDASSTNASAGPDQSKCNNGTFTMAGNTPISGSGTWSVASGSSATIVTSGSPTTSVNSIVSGTCAFLVWTITNGVCTSRDTVKLCNDALPTNANAGSDQTKCNNGTFGMAGNAPIAGIGTWSVASGSSATIVTPGSPTTSVNSVAAGTCAFLVWTITNGICVSRDTVKLCNNPLPTPQITLSDTIICQGTSINLSGANTQGTGIDNISWDTSSTNIGTNTIINGFVPPVGQTTVNLVIKDMNGCIDSVQSSLYVIKVPQVNQVSDFVLCPGDVFNTITFNGTNIENPQFKWTRTTTNIGLTATSGTNSIPNFNTINSGSTEKAITITVTPWNFITFQNKTDSCSGPDKDFEITVNPRPARLTPNEITDTICSGVALSDTLSSTFLTGVNYAWNANASSSCITGYSVSNTSPDSIINDLPLNTCTPVSNGSITYNYTLSYTNNNVTCKSDYTEIVIVLPAPPQPEIDFVPEGSITSGTNSLCAGSTFMPFNLSGYNPAFISEWWTDPPDLIDTVIVGDDSTGTVLISIPESITVPGSITIFANYTGGLTSIKKCASNVEQFIINISQSTGSSDDIYLKQPGNLLVYQNNAMDKYQWGYMDIDSLYLDIISGQTYQALIHPGTMPFDTTLRYYWVLVSKDSCVKRVFYNGPLSRVSQPDPILYDDLFLSSIYPNPGNGEFTLALLGGKGGRMYTRVYNALGEMVYDRELLKFDYREEYLLDLKQLSSGIYHYQIHCETGGKVTGKFIINAERP